MAKLDFSKWVFNRRSDLISFDPTGLPYFDGGVITVYDALASLGEQSSFGDIVTFDEFENDTQQNTTSNIFTEAYVFTTNDGQPSPSDEARPTGRYVVFVSMTIGQSKKDRQYSIRVRTRTGIDSWFTIEPLNTNETNGSDETFKLWSGFAFFNHTDETKPFSVQVEFGETIAGGIARLKNCKVVSWRVQEL